MSHVGRLALTRGWVYRFSMETWRQRLVWTAFVAGAAGLFAIGNQAAFAAPPKASPKLADCVQVRGEAYYASVGYDHLVHLKNGCKKAASCTVKTNVNPDAASVDLAPAEEKTVVTWRGSPAREFTPDVACVER